MKYSSKQPRYRRQGNRAFVEIAGRRFYLGRFNSAESLAEYKTKIKEWEANPSGQIL